MVYLIDGLASSLCLRNRNNNFPLDKLKMTFKGGEPLQEREHRGEKNERKLIDTLVAKISYNCYTLNKVHSHGLLMMHHNEAPRAVAWRY